MSSHLKKKERGKIKKKKRKKKENNNAFDFLIKMKTEVFMC